MYIYQQQPKDGKGDRQVENKREKNQINDRYNVTGKYNRRKEI